MAQDKAVPTCVWQDANHGGDQAPVERYHALIPPHAVGRMQDALGDEDGG